LRNQPLANHQWNQLLDVLCVPDFIGNSTSHRYYRIQDANYFRGDVAEARRLQRIRSDAWEQYWAHQDNEPGASCR